MIRPNGREPCRELSVERGESLAHTAAHLQRWLLVEQPGAWGSNAVRESGLDPDIGEAAAREMSAQGGRLLLVRRPPRRREADPAGPRRWFAVDSGWSERHVRTGAFDDDIELIDLARAMNAAGSDRRGDVHPHELVLVCTHGKHDPCCAEAGREASRAFGELDTEDLWECSHVGGDRFAGNVLLLPSGLYFGRVDGATAVAVDVARRDRRVVLDHYRGRATVSHFAQVAEDLVRRSTGLDGFDDVVPVAEEELDQHHRRVTVRAGADRVVVDVRRVGRTEPAFMTCHSGKMGQGVEWEAVVVDGP